MTMLPFPGDPDTGMLGMASLLATIRNLYPQARVTSGYRGPQNPLTLRNPASLHATGSTSDPGAVDVAPIPGVSFGDYVSSVKKAGVPVTQAFDEATHPFPWTTGPNWHLAAQGNAPVQPYYPPQKKPVPTLASLQQPASPLASGSLMSAPNMTLADLGPSRDLQKDYRHQKTMNTLSTVLGALGDAMMAYSGMQPFYGPAMLKMQNDEADRTFDREKLNAQLEAARQKALEPPQFAQNAAYFTAMSPEDKRAVLQYEDATNPINVSTPQGTQNVPRTSVKTINGKTYYNIGGEWYEESN